MVEQEEIHDRHWKLERAIRRYVNSNWARNATGEFVVTDFTGATAEEKDIAVGLHLMDPFVVNTFRDLIHEWACNIAALRNAANVNAAGVYLTCLTVRNWAAMPRLHQQLMLRAVGPDALHFVIAANTLMRVYQHGGQRLMYIGCSGNFRTRYNPRQVIPESNVRLHQFLRNYAAQHPAAFSFDYKILATCARNPEARRYQSEAWVGQCAKLDAAWNNRTRQSTFNGDRLVLNREVPGQQH